MGRLYKLDKRILLLKGNPEKLLDALGSNTSKDEKNAFLDRSSKIIVTFMQARTIDGDFLIVIEDRFNDRLSEYLGKLLKLAKSSIEETGYFAFYDMDSSYRPGPGEYMAREKKGRVIITAKELVANVSEKEFLEFRLQNNLPVQGIDYDTEMILNVSEGFCSASKGCYPGQEVISRILARSRPPKKLMVAETAAGSELSKKMTSKSIKNGRTRGFVFTAN